MQKISQFRTWASFSVTMLFVALSYEFRIGNLIFPSIPYGGVFIAVIVFAFGSKISDFAVGLALSSKKLRKLIAGKSYIEGFWYLNTAKPKGSSSSLTQTGIACMQYDILADDFKVETVRFTSDGEKYVTISEIAHSRARGQTIRYLNCFRLTYPGPEDRIGLSFGQFALEGNSSPKSLEAHIAVAGEGVSRRQSATRIDDEVVEQFKLEFKDDWMLRYIGNNGNFEESIQ